jgi:hypothetical protein
MSSVKIRSGKARGRGDRWRSDYYASGVESAEDDHRGRAEIRSEEKFSCKLDGHDTRTLQAATARRDGNPAFLVCTLCLRTTRQPRASRVVSVARGRARAPTTCPPTVTRLSHAHRVANMDADAAAAAPALAQAPDAPGASDRLTPLEHDASAASASASEPAAPRAQTHSPPRTPLRSTPRTSRPSRCTRPRACARSLPSATRSAPVRRSPRRTERASRHTMPPQACSSRVYARTTQHAQERTRSRPSVPRMRTRRPQHVVS